MGRKSTTVQNVMHCSVPILSLSQAAWEMLHLPTSDTLFIILGPFPTPNIISTIPTLSLLMDYIYNDLRSLMCGYILSIYERQTD